MHEFDWWSNGSMNERGLGIRDPRNAGDRSGTDLAKLLWSQFGQVLGLNFFQSWTGLEILKFVRFWSRPRIWDRPFLVCGSLLWIKHVVFRPDVIRRRNNRETGSECKNKIHIFRWVVFVHFRRFILHGAVHF